MRCEWCHKIIVGESALPMIKGKFGNPDTGFCSAKCRVDWLLYNTETTQKGTPYPRPLAEEISTPDSFLCRRRKNE